MPFALYAFDSDVAGFTLFPRFDDRHPNAGKPSSNPQFVELMGGASAYVGPRRARVKTPYTVSITGRFIETSPEALDAAIRALNKACHTTGKLYRRSITGATSHVRAYFDTEEMETSHERIFPFAGHWCMDVTLTFQVTDQLWRTRYHGRSFQEGDRFDTGYVENGVDTWTLGNFVTTIPYTIGGEEDVRDIDFVVSAPSTTMTGLTLHNRTNGTKVIYTGPVPANRQLLISTERQAVEHITPLNALLAPGDTQIVCDTTYAVLGGSVSVVLNNGSIWATSVASIDDGLVTVTDLGGAPSHANTLNRIGFGAFWSNAGVRQVTWTQDDWFRLSPGTNDVQITRVGGAATATIVPYFWECE